MMPTSIHQDGGGATVCPVTDAMNVLRLCGVTVSVEEYLEAYPHLADALHAAGVALREQSVLAEYGGAAAFSF